MTAVLDLRRVRRAGAFMIALAMAGSVVASLPRTAHASARGSVSVIVRTQGAQAWHGAEHAVSALGGRVGRELSIIDGFTADVPVSVLARVAGMPGVVSVTANDGAHLLSTGGFDPTTDVGSLYSTTLLTGAQDYWRAGYTGAGVDVALVDSGVAPVEGLLAPDKVLIGPDLSFESQAPNLTNLDTYGHGTHMAGIIAGRDRAAVAPYAGDSANFVGMAPDARIVSIKVADAHGVTDVSQLIAAIDWVVQHRNDRGLNIRVLNLSFGTNSSQPYELDPLAFAAEQAWHHGIVVVAAAGNAGFTKTNSLADPADDPWLIAAGAADTRGTLTTADDTVAAFSQNGNGKRSPDLVAPGVHIASLRDPGSYIDQTYSATGAAGDRFFRGSGTSQAAALVSGAVALLVQQHPNATNDQIKQLLRASAHRLDDVSSKLQGSGEVDLAAALTTPLDRSAQQHDAVSRGTGSLERSRGDVHVSMNGVVLQGERDIFGQHVDTAELAALERSAASWNGGVWNGSTWSGSTWSGSTWSGSTWSGSTWSGSTWSGSTWSGSTWSGSTWSGSTWSGSTWSGSTWSGSTWSGSTWSGSTWSGSTWSGTTWSSDSWV